MLDAYIKSTAGMVSWLFFMVLNLLSPFIKGLCTLFAIGGGLGFLVMGWAWWMAVLKHASMIVTGANSTMPLSYQFFTFLCLGMALAGMSGLIFLEIKMDRMLLAYLYPEQQDDSVSQLLWLRNFCALLVLFAAFSLVARYCYPKLPGFVWPLIGFVWWLGAGVALGVCRWLYRQGATAMGTIAELLNPAGAVAGEWMMRLRSAFTSKRSMSQAEIEAAAKAFVERHHPFKDGNNVVVPFRRRG